MCEVAALLWLPLQAIGMADDGSPGFQTSAKRQPDRGPASRLVRAQPARSAAGVC